MNPLSKRLGRQPAGTDRGRDAVAITLAVGFSSAINIIVAAVLYDAIFSDVSGLSENATQILTGWGGGVLGVLGAYIGFKAGERPATPPTTSSDADDEPDRPAAN